MITKSNKPRLLAVIPARGGSKGLPGKNIRPLAGIPLIAHSIRLSKLCPDITRTLVSTDSQEIVDVARAAGADAPFLRPAQLARDNTPMWDALRHALDFAEKSDGGYQYLLLLDPTSPARLPEDVAGAFHRLVTQPDADGIVGVSQPEFNPIWNCVVERDGWMEHLMPDGSRYTRRQDVPTVYRVNASIYIWRAEFMKRETEGNWTRNGRHLIYEIPEARAIHIDDIDAFARADLLIRNGLIRLPWLQPGASA